MLEKLGTGKRLAQWLWPVRLVRTALLLAPAVALLTGCAALAPSSTVLPTPQPLPTGTPTPNPTATPTPSPTFTAAPSFTPSPTPCQSTSGEVRREEIPSPYLAQPPAFRVYYPPCYDGSGRTRYPVLYMLHGQTYNDDQWERLGMTAATDELIASGTSRPFLIVMPYETEDFADPYSSGYTDALLETLLPWVDANLPTCTVRECRAVGGLSRGGAYAFLLALDHPDLFAAAGGHSMVPFGGMDNRLKRQLAAMAPGELPRLWIDMGESDRYFGDLSAYERLLTQLGVPHETHFYPGGHNESYWAAHVEEYLRWYVAGFPGE